MNQGAPRIWAPLLLTKWLGILLIGKDHNKSETIFFLIWSLVSLNFLVPYFLGSGIFHSILFEPGRPYKRIHVKLLIEGEIPGDKIIRAASLSFDKYCSVSKNLEKSTLIEHSIYLNGELIKK